ncbi:MAG: antibiotic biosynthesis monooxygenase [Bacteroidota bacterium]
MIVRYVKMTFEPERVPDFLEVFAASRDKIRAFDGCHHLELLQDTQHPHVLMTHSHWASEEHLNHYRHSDLFRATWAKTKPLFAAKPVAWSMTVVG